MAQIKLVCWNMSWMNDLFNRLGNFRPDDEVTIHDKEATVKQRRDQLAKVIEALDPDILVVVEGPNRTEELQLFFDTDVVGKWKCHIQNTPRSAQAVGCAFRTDKGRFKNSPFKIFDTGSIDAFKPFEMDNENDSITEKYKFTRRPLYVEAKPKTGKTFRLMGLHLKSKGIFDSLEWSRWWQQSEANRRRILAEATQIRLNFLNPYLKENTTKNKPLVVCGDINDGPGFDAAEKKIFASGIERLMGHVWCPELVMGNALYDNLLTEKEKNQMDFSDLSTTSFKDPIFNYVYHRVWIDHILYTRNVAGWVKKGAIHEKINDKFIWREYPFSSDHYPVSCMIDLD